MNKQTEIRDDWALVLLAALTVAAFLLVAFGPGNHSPHPHPSGHPPVSNPASIDWLSEAQYELDEGKKGSR